MPPLPPFPELPPPGERPAWVETLLQLVAAQAEQIHRLREESQALRDEVARLRSRSRSR